MDSLLPWLIATLAHTLATAVSTTPDAGALHDPTDIALGSDEGAVMLAGVRGVLDTQLADSDRRRLGRKVLSESRVRIAGGTFPGSGAAIVTVNVPLRPKDPLAEPRFISGVFTLDQSGALASIVVAPKMQATRFNLTAIGDTDGDGHDDLSLTVVGGGVDEERLVTWESAAPKITTRSR